MRRSPREARVLGLWTAGWLAVLLLIGLAWVGNWRLEWPVLVIPAGWAVIALARGSGGQPQGRTTRDRARDVGSRPRHAPRSRWDRREG
jgi:uncharacterized iron-regulated membrane protein